MTTTDSSSLMKTLQKNEVKVINAAVIIVIVFASLVPTGLPITISDPTIKMYDGLSSLKSGEVVWFSFDQVFVVLPEVKASIQAVLQHLFMIPGIKILITSSYADGPAIYEGMISVTNKYGKVYGTDYVFLGYVVGNELSIANLARDIKVTCPVDNYGTPLANLPMMDTINGAKDIARYVTITLGPQFYWYIRQVVAPYQIPMYTISVGYFLSEIMPFFASGQLSGYIVGLKGGAEYETLIGTKGLASRGADAMSLVYGLLMVAVVGVNINYLRKHKGGK